MFSVYFQSTHLRPEAENQREARFAVLWISLSTCLVPEMGLGACEKNARW